MTPLRNTLARLGAIPSLSSNRSPNRPPLSCFELTGCTASDEAAKRCVFHLRYDASTTRVTTDSRAPANGPARGRANRTPLRVPRREPPPPANAETTERQVP